MPPEERTVRWNDTAQVIRPTAQDCGVESAFRKRIREATEERDRLFKKARIPDRPTRRRAQSPSEKCDGTNVAKVELALRRLSIPGPPTMGGDAVTSPEHGDSEERKKGMPPRGNEVKSGGYNVPKLQGVDEKDLALRAIPIPPRPPRKARAGEDAQEILRDPASRPTVPLRPGRKPAGAKVEIPPRPDARISPTTPAATSQSIGKAPLSEAANTTPEVVAKVMPQTVTGRKGKARAHKRGEQMRAEVGEGATLSKGTERKALGDDTHSAVVQGAMPPKGADQKGKAPAEDTDALTRQEPIAEMMPPKGTKLTGKAHADPQGKDNSPEVVEVVMPPTRTDRKGKARADDIGEPRADSPLVPRTAASGYREVWVTTPTKLDSKTIAMNAKPAKTEFTIMELLTSPTNCSFKHKPADIDQIMSDREKRSRIRANLRQSEQGPSEKKLKRERDNLKQEGLVVDPRYVKDCVTARARHNAMPEEDRIVTHSPLDGPLICGIFEYELGLQVRFERRERLFQSMLPVLDDLDALQEERIALLHMT